MTVRTFVQDDRQVVFEMVVKSARKSDLDSL